MRYRILLATSFLSALTGCDVLDMVDAHRVTADFHYTYPMKPGGRLSIDNQNGSIEISGWDQDQVEISGVKFAASEEELQAVKIDITAAADSISIRTNRPEARRGSSGAKYVVKAPRRTRLDRVVSTNGHVRAENLQGEAQLRTSNGSVRVFHLSGDLEATTTNGSIEMDSLEGGATVRTSNGRIRAERVTGALDARTTNGSITADLAKPAPNQAVKLSTSNGSVELTLGVLSGNDVRASTSNGSITVRLPGSAGARVQARTSRSRITTEFDVKTAGEAEKHRLEGTIGAGGPLLDLSTSNGAIRLLKL
jgi:DUF4097 and DUF4098 domain-containing protein YvlB